MARVIKAKELRAKNTVALARWLLGKHLVRRGPDGRAVAHRITEVEAYDGERDLACHARVGRTERTAVMYGPGGIWYVYLCYGVHEMLNLVVRPRDRPAAVLIRGVAAWNGPGRLTRALGIDRRLNGRPASRTSGLWLEDRGDKIPRGAITATPRIGVDYAGPVWAAKPWRFVLELKPGAKKPAPARRPNKPVERPGALADGRMLNLGPKSSGWLRAIGIESAAQVRALGPIEVCRRLFASRRPVSVVMAYALEGALAGCHWNAIPWETKRQLGVDFARMKREVRG
jgi:DNA-3-methyladenine glycosylase